MASTIALEEKMNWTVTVHVDLRVLYVWLVAVVHTRADLSSVGRQCGLLCAIDTAHGEQEVRLLCAVSWDIAVQVRVLSSRKH